MNIVVPESAWEGVEENAEGLIDHWLVEEGERVEAGHSLALIVIVKASFELPAPASGVVERILVGNEKTFRREQALAVLRED
ncbi:MAG TPA: lipoyl domain-containing protein [Burkholderiaceae bacterium]|nr:lipoyl domain-containing protein [Burkholderiaceae bacterium]